MEGVRVAEWGIENVGTYIISRGTSTPWFYLTTADKVSALYVVRGQEMADWLNKAKIRAV